MNFKSVFFAVAISVAATLPVQAAGVNILDNWNLNLSAANGVMHSGGGSFSGLTDITNIDRLSLNGQSVVRQSLGPGDQPFTDSGHLVVTGAFLDTPVGFFDPTILHLDPLGNGGFMNLFFEFDDLRGVRSESGAFTFTPGQGTIKLWLEDDGDNDSTTGNRLQLAMFDILAPSGGSAPDFLGGSGENGTLDITLVQTSGIDGLYTDENGNELPKNDPRVLHLGNLNALCGEGNACAGVPFVLDDPGGFQDGDTVVLLDPIQNGGQSSPAAVPIPAAFPLFASALVGLGLVARRKKRAA